MPQRLCLVDVFHPVWLYFRIFDPIKIFLNLSFYVSQGRLVKIFLECQKDVNLTYDVILAQKCRQFEVIYKFKLKMAKFRLFEPIKSYLNLRYE